MQNDDGSYLLSDFGSTNGTYINGKKVDGEVGLNEDDFVRVGNTTIPWIDYFSDDFVDTTPDDSEERSTVFSPAVQTGQNESSSGKKAGWIVGIVMSAILLFAGAIGALSSWIFRSSHTMFVNCISAAATGALFLVLNIVMLAISSRKKY